METKQYIPQEVQGMIDAINQTPLHLGEVEIHSHPKILVEHTRSLRIVKMIPNFENLPYPRTDIYYKQVLRDLDGIEIPNNLSAPQWTIHTDETSSIRDESQERIMVPLQQTVMETIIVDEGLETEHEEEVYVLDEEGEKVWEFVQVDGENVMELILISSHKYLLFLLQNNLVGLLQLLAGYLQERLVTEPEFVEEIDSL